MAGTAVEEVELIGTGKGGDLIRPVTTVASAAAKSGSPLGPLGTPAHVRHRDDRPRRIPMFFMALVSAYIVRKDMPNSAWVELMFRASFG